jgi:hypothetical protein
MSVKTNYLCKDCKYSVITLRDQILWAFNDSEHRYSCKKSAEEQEPKINLVTGKLTKKKTTYELCSVARLDAKGSECGPEAKYWAPKHKKDLFRALIK